LRFYMDLLSRVKHTISAVISSWGIGKRRRGWGQANRGDGESL
jgi:hypothetical protein